MILGPGYTVRTIPIELRAVSPTTAQDSTASVLQHWHAAPVTGAMHINTHEGTLAYALYKQTLHHDHSSLVRDTIPQLSYLQEGSFSYFFLATALPNATGLSIAFTHVPSGSSGSYLLLHPRSRRYCITARRSQTIHEGTGTSCSGRVAGKTSSLQSNRPATSLALLSVIASSSSHQPSGCILDQQPMSRY